MGRSFRLHHCLRTGMGHPHVAVHFLSDQLTMRARLVNKIANLKSHIVNKKNRVPFWRLQRRFESYFRFVFVVVN